MPTALCTWVKLPDRPLTAASVSSPHTSRLFYVTDKGTGTRYLVDTGSEVSVIPPSPSDHTHASDQLTLLAVNNTHITTYGTRSLTLNLSLRRKFQWIFIIASVQKPIIGADFLRHFGLLVDMSKRQLTDSSTLLRIHGIATQDSSPSPYITPKNPDSPYLKLLSHFQPSRRCVRPTRLSNTISRTTLRPQILQPSPAQDAWHQNGCRSPERSLSTCCSWGLYAPPLDPGFPPCTWCRRKLLETGGPVVIIAH